MAFVRASLRASDSSQSPEIWDSMWVYGFILMPLRLSEYVGGAAWAKYATWMLPIYGARKKYGQVPYNWSKFLVPTIPLT